MHRYDDVKKKYLFIEKYVKKYVVLCFHMLVSGYLYTDTN